jgi:hypothetical protein
MLKDPKVVIAITIGANLVLFGGLGLLVWFLFQLH